MSTWSGARGGTAMRGFGRLDVLTTPSTCRASMRLRPMPPATAATPIVPALAIRKRRRVHSGEAASGPCPGVPRGEPDAAPSVAAGWVSSRRRRDRGSRPRAELTEQEAQGDEPGEDGDGRVDHGGDRIDERRPDGSSGRHGTEHHEDRGPEAEPPRSEDARHCRKGDREPDDETDERGLVVRAEQRYHHVLRARRLEVDRERPDGHDERRSRRTGPRQARRQPGRRLPQRCRPGRVPNGSMRCAASEWSWRQPTGPV